MARTKFPHTSVQSCGKKTHTSVQVRNDPGLPAPEQNQLQPSPDPSTRPDPALTQALLELLADGHSLPDAVQRMLDSTPTRDRAQVLRTARDVADRLDVFIAAPVQDKRTAISANLLRIQRKARELGDLEVEIKALVALAKVEGLELDPGLVEVKPELTEAEVDIRVQELLEQHPELRAKLQLVKHDV